jgi:hypothetical protein
VTLARRGSVTKRHKASRCGQPPWLLPASR